MKRQRKPTRPRGRPALAIPMPVCDVCQESVEARVCGVAPTTPESVAAIQQVLLEMHKRMAHPPTAEVS